MQLQAAQVLEPVVPTVRSRDGGDTQSGGRAFWELLAEHGPDRAGSKGREAIRREDEPAEAAPVEAEANGGRSRAAVSTEGGVAQGETGESAEETARSLAAAILAEFQPLTIGTLNQRILRADPRAVQRAVAGAGSGAGGGTAQLTETQPGSGLQTRQARVDADQQRTEARSVQPSELPQEEAAETAKRQSEVALDRGREASGRLDAETTDRPQDAQARAANTASHARAGQPVAAIAAAGSAAHHAPKAIEASAVRPVQTASPVAASIAGGAGRKAGGDAHMPRWDAQKPASGNTRTAVNEGQAAQVASQVARGMAVALSRADGALTLRLNPGSLGFVRIRMEVESGTLHARFEASTDQARRLLEQSSETLRASLEAKGWESSRFRVDLLREADPAAEMLRRLEQQAESRLERFGPEDSAAERDPGAGTSGGDREHSQSKPGFSSQGGEGELGAEPVQPEGDPAMGSVMMVSSSRVDTIA